MSPSLAPMEDVAPEQAKRLIDAGEIQLIDVREPHEVEAGRIAGARHIEMNELSAQADSIERDKPVLFYCHSGSRSGMAAQAFRQAGYDAGNLTGGIRAWHEAGLPLEPSAG